jgi:hypothetical protein
MGHQERRERIASELFVAAVREERLLRVDRGPEGKSEKLEFGARGRGLVSQGRNAVKRKTRSRE